MLRTAKEIEEAYFKQPKHYTLFSGGAKGSDLHWQENGAKFGVNVKVFSFESHARTNTARVILTATQLRQADEYVLRANKTLKRHFPTGKSFVDNLLRRNWHQVKDTESVFAIAKVMPSQRTVEGGTGWAVQMAIDSKKIVYVFDTARSNWYKFNYESQKFVPCRSTPKLTLLSTGIGTRQLTDTGRKAIDQVFKATFEYVQTIVSCDGL